VSVSEQGANKALPGRFEIAIQGENQAAHVVLASA
jgi:hypothetical protein